MRQFLCNHPGRISLLLVLACTLQVAGEVTRVEITRREPFAGGQAFGETHSYERISGSLVFEVSPDSAANRWVVDLHRASLNEAGRATFRAEFFLLRPQDLSKHGLIYEADNRGNKLLLPALNDGERGNDPSTAAHAGNGFLMRRGYAILWVGWNGDVQPGENRLTVELPVARSAEGPITGRVYSEICVDRPSFSEPLCGGGTRVYPAADVDTRHAELAMRPERSSPPIIVSPDRWSFARWESGQTVPDPSYLYLKEGFRPGWLYELIYTARDPRVSGLAAVIVRDAVSFFRYSDGGPGRENPLAGRISRACAFGISQSARFLQHCIYQGQNADENGRLIFDGVLAHVGGAGKASFNQRFAQITRHGSQHEDNLFPSDCFPFTTVPQIDPVTGDRGDWLMRVRAAGCLPKIVMTSTSTEYWNRGMSLVHTDVDGTKDMPLDPNVRLYHIAGGHHLFFAPPDNALYQNPVNALNYRPVLRAALVALDDWVTHGTAPPPSTYPLIIDGTLISVATWQEQFPRLPDVHLPSSSYVPLRLDPGPRWNTQGIADLLPPRVGPAYITRVPAVDADGNERAGIRLPDVAAAIGTYAGWNLRHLKSGAEGKLIRWCGSSWPLPRTDADGARRGDPRPSLRGRYASRDDYLTQVNRVMEALVRERYLLAEDARGLIRQARGRDFWGPSAQPQ